MSSSPERIDDEALFELEVERADDLGLADLFHTDPMHEEASDHANDGWSSSNDRAVPNSRSTSRNFSLPDMAMDRSAITSADRCAR